MSQEPSAEAIALLMALDNISTIPPKINLYRGWYERAAKLDTFAAQAVAAHAREPAPHGG